MPIITTKCIDTKKHTQHKDLFTQNLLRIQENLRSQNHLYGTLSIHEAQITKHANFQFLEHLIENIYIYIINFHQIQHRKNKEENNNILR